MKQVKEIASVYTAGLIQGVTLVAFPAVSSVLTNPDTFNLSSVEYGSLFIPQSVIAILSSFASSKLIKEIGAKRVFLLGLLANLISMSLLAASVLFTDSPLATLLILMAATGFLGLGFGLTVPTVNIMAPHFDQNRIDAMILILNALLGVGTALSPVFVAVFIGLGFWWGLPLFLVALLFALIIFSFPLPLPGGGIKTATEESQGHIAIPHKFWLFALFALLYGTVETLNGNWIVLYMKQHEAAAVALQSIALSVFWGMVTIGRVFFALVEKYLPQEVTFRTLPFVAVAAFIIISFIPSEHPYAAIAAFGFAGIACSALLPLVISFGQAQLSTASTFATGGIIAFYLAGYGVAAFGAGGLHDATGMSLQDIYGIGALVALILAVVAVKIGAQQKKVTSKREE